MIDQFLLLMNKLLIKKIKNSIVSDIINDKKIDFPTDTDHISLPNSAEEIKQQKINEEEIFLKTELKKTREI